MDEMWMPFPNHSRYEISNTGKVRRADTLRERSPVKIKSGYMTIMLTDRGKYELEYIHRAVAIAFIPNPKNLPQVNHIDRNRANNLVDNLEWCTAKYNVQHGKGRPISCFTKDGVFIDSFVCAREAERQLGLSRGTIDKAARGEYHTSYGFIWRYL